MITEKQRNEFVAALESKNLGCIDSDDVVETRDSVDDFARHNQFVELVKCDYFKIIFFKSGKRQVYVVDFGEARAAYAE